MPALYAHNRFGADVFENLEGEVKSVIKNHYTQFRVGLQGPDILFFYRPWKKNEVSKTGYHMHDVSAFPVFEKAVKMVQQKGKNSREYAYVLGFICHFILDSECHPYVNHMAEKIKVSHMEIEGEYEKALLRKDNRDALAYPIWKYLPTDDATVGAIHAFYENVEKKDIKEALTTYKFVKRILTAPTKIHQSIVYLILRIIGKYKEYYGLMHPYHDNPKCQRTNAGLDKRYEAAIEVAVQMIYSFDETEKQNTKLNERFDRTFD